MRSSLFLFVILCSRLRCCVSSVVDQCCRRRGVSETCNRMLCNPSNPPNDFDVYNIFDRKINCLPYMNYISECLADGRNHMHCCMTEAKDRDENACFGLCRGEGIDGVAAWDKYQTCLAINLHPIFKCFERGYQNTPTPPQSVQILSKTTDSAVLSWALPAVNPSLAHSYHVVCKETDGEAVEKAVDTRNTKVTLSGLRADSKYSASVVAVTRDGNRRSLASEEVHFHTAGVAPRVTAYRETVAIPKYAGSVTLACRMQMPGTIHRSARVEWKKVDESTGRFETLSGEKYSLTNYISFHGQPRHYVSALQIKPLDVSDFGTYRCVASNDFGSSSSDIRLTVRMVTPATAVPPESPYMCCQRQRIRSPCAAVCGTEYGKRASLRAEAFMNNKCEDEISKFLSCTVADVDEGACCLRRKVPSICLPLCDGSQMQSKDIPHVCAPHTFSIFECRMEQADNRPATVSGLKATTQGESVLLRWNSTERADMYHVYWRRRPSTSWEVSSVIGTSKRVNGADEVVVVASNGFGNAHAARLVNENGKWIAFYY
uniref:Ig-like and fibronectin type-III domain-containing protein n=1 Tax=Ascaris suum TaxID=6253 RepID=F1KWL4_ASCSU